MSNGDRWLPSAAYVTLWTAPLLCTQSGLSVDLTPSTRRLRAPPRLLALAALRTGARASQIARRAVSTEVLAERAKLAVLDPHRNGVIEALATPRPLLGLFNDIPRHQFRESDARAWAVAGFDFVVNDAEHSGNDLLYGREENACLQRYGLTPIQRLPREAVSAHGDALAGGARGTMRPYALTLDDAQTYVEAADFPVSGAEGLRRHARGAFPVRGGDGAVTFTPETLRDAEQGRTLACLQFETEEYLFDEELRRKVLGVLSKRGNARVRLRGRLGRGDAVWVARQSRGRRCGPVCRCRGPGRGRRRRGRRRIAGRGRGQHAATYEARDADDRVTGLRVRPGALRGARDGGAVPRGGGGV